MSDTPCPICYPDGIKEPAAQQDARENVTSTSAPAVSAAPTPEESSLRRVAAKAITPGTGDELESKRLKRELAAAKTDLEKGFMQGAYARLKNLQDAERERDALKVLLTQLIDSIQSIDDLYDAITLKDSVEMHAAAAAIKKTL